MDHFLGLESDGEGEGDGGLFDTQVEMEPEPERTFAPLQRMTTADLLTMGSSDEEGRTTQTNPTQTSFLNPTPKSETLSQPNPCMPRGYSLF